MIERYSIPLVDCDITTLLHDWSWLVPGSYKVELITKFGDWFFSVGNNRIYFLDLLEGTLLDVCSLHDFIPNDISFISNFKSLLSVDWTEICLKKNLLLEAGQCYGWKVHPILGGRLASDNIQVFTLSTYESINAQIFKQINEQPRGLKVTGFAVNDLQ